MIITISGKPGSGKTEIAKRLAQKLGYTHTSVGDIQGKLAIEKGITITQLMKLEKENPEIHKQIDKKIEEIGKTKDNFIIDGWIAYYFIPSSFKIFLDVQEKIGANRIFNANRKKDEPKKESVEATIKELRVRVKEAYAGFKKAYNIHPLEKENYDLVLDTSCLSPKQIIEKIFKKIKPPQLYLCHPRESRNKIRKWELEFEKRTGIRLVNPFFDINGEDAEKNHLGKEKYEQMADSASIVEGDIKTIANHEITGLVAIIDTTNSWGTAMEMVYAKKIFKKKVYSVVLNKDHHHPWLKYHSDKIFTSLPELEKFLVEKFGSQKDL